MSDCFVNALLKQLTQQEKRILDQVLVGAPPYHLK